jgi:ElaB/YqjD/DUF883 family membrane-anchored ribosome-binding protein
MNKTFFMFLSALALSSATVTASAPSVPAGIVQAIKDKANELINNLKVAVKPYMDSLTPETQVAINKLLNVDDFAKEIFSSTLPEVVKKAAEGIKNRKNQIIQLVNQDLTNQKKMWEQKSAEAKKLADNIANLERLVNSIK